MLHHSLPGSSDSSRPASPHRRLTRALGGASSTPNRPPPEAEFVGSSPSLGGPHGISSNAFSPNYFDNFFVEERELGRGGKGVVLLVKHVLDGVSLGHFALKRIPVGDDHEWLAKVLVEVQLLQHLSHQNLVSYRHVWLETVQITPFGPSVPCAFVLQQYCNAGDLHNYILQGMKTTTTKEQLKQRLRRRSKHEPEPPDEIAGPRRLHFEEIHAFFKDIASGLNHLHANNYIHRDLKPNNCLLHDTGKGLRVLVSDFGEVQSENQVRNSTGATGTISYCAPEVLRRDPSTGSLGNFTTKSDIFSLGMILYFLCFAKLPYRSSDQLNESNEDIDMLREEIITWAGIEDHKSLRSDLPDKLYRFLRRLLSLDPINRPSAEEILHGIKTGTGLEEYSDRVRESGHVEDIRSSSHISPADTPPSGDSAPLRPARRPSAAQARKTTPSRLNITPYARDIQSPAYSGFEEEQTDLASPSSLVLRTPHASPVKVDNPRPSILPRRRSHFKRSESIRTFKIACFLLKIMSIYLTCLPLAARPVIGLSLLGLASADLLLLESGFRTSLALAAVHCVLLAGAVGKEKLCLPKMTVWEDI